MLPDSERPVRRLLHNDSAASPPPGLVFVERGNGMAKAKEDGVYEIGGGRFKVRAGDPIPDGAEFKKSGEASGKLKDAEAATIAAGDAKLAPGPDETTAGAGPSETVNAQSDAPSETVGVKTESEMVGLPKVGRPKQQ